jgi:hypothetical protein
MITIMIMVFALATGIGVLIESMNRNSGDGCGFVFVCLIVLVVGTFGGMAATKAIVQTPPITYDLMALDNGKFISISTINDEQVFMMKTADKGLIAFPAFQPNGDLHITWHKTTDNKPKIVIHYSKPTATSNCWGFTSTTQTYYDIYYLEEVSLNLNSLNPVENQK